MHTLTEKQRAILRFIYIYRYDFDMSPTVYDIAYHFGLKIPSVFAHLSSLVKRRLITKTGKARSIKLIATEEQLAELDNRFHEIMYEACNSKMLEKQLRDFHDYVLRVRKKTLSFHII